MKSPGRRWSVVGALLLLGCGLAGAILPVATLVLAPAMRAMLARATEAAVSQVGTAGVRAALARTVPIAGFGLPVTVARTWNPVAVGAAALAVGGVAAAIPWLATVDCAFQGGSIVCDQSVPPAMVLLYTRGYTGGSCSASTMGAAQACGVAGQLAYWQGQYGAPRSVVAVPGTCNVASLQCASGHFNVMNQGFVEFGVGGWDASFTTSNGLACSSSSTGASFDGRCKTGIMQAESPSQLTARVLNRPPPAADQVEISRQVVEKGYLPTEVETPQEITGPAFFDMPDQVRQTTRTPYWPQAGLQ